MAKKESAIQKLKEVGFLIDLSYKVIEELKKENPALRLEIEKESKKSD